MTNNVTGVVHDYDIDLYMLVCQVSAQLGQADRSMHDLDRQMVDSHALTCIGTATKS